MPTYIVEVDGATAHVLKLESDGSSYRRCFTMERGGRSLESVRQGARALVAVLNLHATHV